MKEELPHRDPVSRQVKLLASSDLVDVQAVHELACAGRRIDTTMSSPASLGTAYFQSLLSRATGMMVGAFKDGKIVAHLGVTGPIELREAIALHILTNNDVPFPHAALTESILIFTHASVSPFEDEAELTQLLVAYALGLPLSQVVDHVFMQVAVNNTVTWSTLVDHGFGIVAAAYDANNHEPRFIFQKPSFGFDFSPAIIADDVDPLLDFSAIVNLTQRDALVGRYDEDSETRLAFFRSRDVLNTLPTLAKVQNKG